MKKTLMLLLALAAAGGAPAQTGQAGLKAGLWETTTTRMTADGKDMKAQFAASAEQMKKQIASLPPEQRKKAEAMLAQQGEIGRGKCALSVDLRRAARERLANHRQQLVEIFAKRHHLASVI